MHTRADALPSQPIDIGPGETLILSGTELSVIYNNYSENDIEYSGITIEQIINDQSLPDGVYNICIRAYGYFTNEPLSHGSPAGCAVPCSVLSVDPPIITYPLNQQTMIPIDPQLLNINWILA